MEKNILCLTGWGQSSDSIDFILKDFSKFSSYKISNFDYFNFANFAQIKENIQNNLQNSQIILSWSLGAQLALRLILDEIILPKYLILIAPPFQMVKNEKIKAAMSKEVFTEFYNNFKQEPDATLKKFAILTAMNDKNAKEIAKNLKINDKNHENLTFWLKELEKFSFFDFDFAKFNEICQKNQIKILFFQGKGDKIVHESQSLLFKEKIENLNLVSFANCGHAPHLSDLQKFREICDEFVV